VSRDNARPGLVLYGHPNDDKTSPGGPPNKYSRELHDKIVKLVQTGFTPEHVAVACGISKSTFASWLQKGSEGDPWLVDFYEDVEAAMGMAALKNEQRILDGLTVQDACPKCGRSDEMTPKHRLALSELAIKVAERRDGKNWNKQHNVVVRNELDAFLNDCQQLLPPKIYGTLLQIAARSGGEGPTDYGVTEDDE
jgi:hypothetical protein